ncbi:hypothetical protein Btru_033478 [Bulinus truncatus]|nr:hypothetical protein Btru_033478 [Bulinus truncatus]
MGLNSLYAMTLLVSTVGAFYIGHDYDVPDQKYIRRNAFGQLQSFDVSHERKFVQNAYGGISAVNVAEFSDPDVYHRAGPAFLPPPNVYPPFAPVVPLPPQFNVPSHPYQHIVHHYWRWRGGEGGKRWTIELWPLAPITAAAHCSYTSPLLSHDDVSHVKHVTLLSSRVTAISARDKTATRRCSHFNFSSVVASR